MKSKLLCFFITLAYSASYSQCPNFQNSQITTQSQIDNFATNYPNCFAAESTGLTISGNSITNLNGLSQLTSLSYLVIKNTPNLSNLSGLQNIQTLSQLTIQNCDLLTDLVGLNNLTQVNSIEIKDCNSIVNFNGINSLQSFGYSLRITNNSELNSLSAFSNVLTFGIGSMDNSFYIQNNNNLLNLDGLENIVFEENITNSFYFDISSNINLSSCSKPNICNLFNIPFINIVIENNSLGCANQSEVQANCEALSTGDLPVDKLLIHPNPTNDWINIESYNISENYIYSLLNVFGKELSHGNTDSMIDLSKYPSGIYFLKINNEGKIQQFKVIRK